MSNFCIYISSAFFPPSFFLLYVSCFLLLLLVVVVIVVVSCIKETGEGTSPFFFLYLFAMILKSSDRNSAESDIEEQERHSIAMTYMCKFRLL